VLIAAALPATSEPPGPDAPRPEARQRAIEGQWSEEFESRVGCADTVTIAQRGRGLVIDGKDCNGGTDYAFSDVKYDGTSLSLELHVSETGYVVRYSLHWLPDGSLGGHAVVNGGPSPARYKIRWARSRGSDDR
jgi:hypothetical protein